VRTNEPDMNITNQINAGLNDIRSTLIELSVWAKTPDISDQLKNIRKAKYQLDLIMDMIKDHRQGRSQPWSDRKCQVDEEFS
jgi:hypothetical protein